MPPRKEFPNSNLVLHFLNTNCTDNRDVFKGYGEVQKQGSCITSVKKGKLNLALRSVARHLCRICALSTNEPESFLRNFTVFLRKIRRIRVQKNCRS